MVVVGGGDGDGERGTWMTGAVAACGQRRCACSDRWSALRVPLVEWCKVCTMDVCFGLELCQSLPLPVLSLIHISEPTRRA